MPYVLIIRNWGTNGIPHIAGEALLLLLTQPVTFLKPCIDNYKKVKLNFAACRIVQLPYVLII